MFLEFVVNFNMKYFFGKFLKIICKNVLCCKKFKFEGFFYSCFIYDLLFYGKMKSSIDWLWDDMFYIMILMFDIESILWLKING